MASETPREKSTSRRDFLKAAGLGAAVGVAGGGVGGAFAGAAVAGAANGTPPSAHPTFAPLPERSAPGFDHIVVVMFENRSFDNMLGHLYGRHEKTKAEFDGLPQGDYSNPGPGGAEIAAHIYSGPTDRIMQSPQPDPGEPYPHVNTQLFGVQNDDFNTPAPGAVAHNRGFVTDYIRNFEEVRQRQPDPAEYAVIMGGFEPAMLPVLSTLAREFGVYDAWFAGVPSQTFCNRSFFHASTSHGFVTNQDGGGYSKWLGAPYAPTIFNRLSDAGHTWRVYYDASQLVSLTGMLNAPALERYWRSHFRTMEQFYRDAENGSLPDYAFIEPRMIFNHNDFHPPFGELREGKYRDAPYYNSALSDVRAGDALLGDIYTAIRSSSSPGGSNAVNTALVVTFDEHGGTYDHVAPPKATPPTDGAGGEMGFAFDRLGCRVPAIVVSAYTEPGTVIHDEMHHGSVIATLNRLHGMSPLTRRDANATPIFNAINRTKARQPDTWPSPQPMWIPPNPEDVPTPTGDHRLRPLTPPAKGLLGILLAKYAPHEPVPETYQDAYAALQRHGLGLFGTTD